MTPAGAAENVGDAVRELASAVGSFGAEVRAGMVQREAELRATVAQRTGMDIAPRR
jgi:chromosome condensin MukBEF MukE localization factor